MNTITSNEVDPTRKLDLARTHLERLDVYLDEDPENGALLSDAFRAALTCSDWERATEYLRRGQVLVELPLQWALHEAELLMAQELWAQAKACLELLEDRKDTSAGFRLAVACNLGFVFFQEGDFAGCVKHLTSLLEDGATALVEPATQQLWLRALHRTGELDRALRWARGVESHGGLSPQAASVASLIAFDASDIANAVRWSDLAIGKQSEVDLPLEALVARASLSLAINNAAECYRYAQDALRIKPSDGRAWSVLAFAQMLSGQIEAARHSFAKAVHAMPRHIGTWHGLAWAQIQLGDLNAALTSFQSALALDRNFAESYGGIAVVLAMQNKATPAREYIEIADRLDKTNVSGRYALSILSGDAQDAQALQRLAQRLLAGRTTLAGTSLGEVVNQKPLNG
jgi:tetratricopeptide (TPR) repeat protein